MDVRPRDMRSTETQSAGIIFWAPLVSAAALAMVADDGVCWLGRSVGVEEKKVCEQMSRAKAGFYVAIK